MKRIFAIAFLNHFVSGGLALTIPLLLLERNVGLAEIGVVISILPLFFLFMRLFFAALADEFGWEPFYILLNTPGGLFSTIIYFLANSTPILLLGKIVESVKVSSYWAVNRTAIFELSPGKKEKEATRNIAVISLSTAIGSAISGLTITIMGFSWTLIVLAIASAFVGIPAAMLWKPPRRSSTHNSREIVASLDPRGRDRRFWLISLILLFFSLAIYPLTGLVLPIFMAQQLEYGYITIGIAFMIYNLTSSTVTFGTLGTPLDLRRVIIQSSIALFVGFFLAVSGGFFFAVFLALALANGLGIGFFESLIAEATKNRLSVSVDIGFLHLPMRFAEFLSVLFAGFVTQSFGYLPVFVTSGVFFTVFSFLSLYTLKT